MSSICQSFESNAWRSDLCSHCFQSRDEHEAVTKPDVPKDATSSSSIARYQSVLNRSSYRHTQPAPSSVEKETDANKTTASILKSPGKTGPKSKCVNFPDEDDAAAEVIGYGGHECLESDQEDDDEHHSHHSSDEDDTWSFTDEERVIHNQTQKNTSFNSVSRNLLASEVATFKSHGVSSSSSSSSAGGTSKSAPLVTIRPFGQDSPVSVGPSRAKSGHYEAPKVNPVSPMRNGQALGAEASRENVKSNQAKEDETPRDGEEKFTSFTDPTPPIAGNAATEASSNSGHSSINNSDSSTSSSSKKNNENDPKALVLQSSRVASGRIDDNNAKNQCKNSTLSRKPPVWREKPRIPIKPQAVAAQQDVAKTEAQKPVYAVPKSNRKEDEKPDKIVVVELLANDETRNDERADKVNEETSGLKAERLEGRVTESGGHGPVSIHFVTDVKAADALEKERSALERLDQLDQSNDASTTPPDSLEYNVAALPSTPPTPPPPPPEEESSKDRFEARHNSTRGLTRSAFEALRANLAGSLELSRMVKQQQQQQQLQQPKSSNGSVKRQAPPTPEVEKVEKARTDQAGAVAEKSGKEEEKQSIPPIPPPPPPPAATQPQPVLKVKRSTERALSASPRFRTSLVCASPEGEHVDTASHPRSVSLTRVERCDSERQSKPSIRKIIKERATQLLSIADGSSKGSARLSRADRFAAEGTKKGKGRFSSIRKLLGLKKEVDIEQQQQQQQAHPVEAVKVRPEIVHPIDFHPIGQVEVVSAKPEHVLTLTNSQPESLCSGDSGRNSSLDFQPSDSSLASGSSGSDAGSSPAASLLSASFKHTTPSGRPKPPPPPRLSYKETSGASPTSNKPARPPPPKTSELLHIQKASPALLESRSNSSATEYANLGEVRRAMSPKKPERSSSMRVKELRPVSAVNTNLDILAVADNRLDGLHYDCVTIGQQQQQPGLGPGAMKATSAGADEDGYIIPLRMKSTPSFSSAGSSSSSSAGSSQRLSLTSFNPASSSSSYGQQQQQPSSLTSSTDTSSSTPASRRTLRPGGIRQSRMDLHIKLENHYGTVTGANFQALAQLLEQATSKRPLAAHFHELRRIKGLDWNAFGSSTEHDIVLLRTSTVTVLKSTWQSNDLLLSVYHHSLQDNADNKAPFAQPSVVNFHDQVPAPFLSIPGNRAGVEVFPPGQVATLKQLPHIFSLELDGLERMQHCLSVLLQMCRALEWLLQQQRPLGRLSHEEVVFYREHSQDAYRLLWLAQLPADSEFNVGGLSVRETLTGTIRLLAPLLTNALVDKISSVLQRDGHHPLAAVLDTLCHFLEFALFGPSTDLFDGDPDPVEMFQRWLDVERASALNELIRTQGLWRVKLSIIEEFRLSFLVTTTPQSLLDTSQI